MSEDRENRLNSAYFISFESSSKLSVVYIIAVVPVELLDNDGEAGSGGGDSRLYDAILELLMGQSSILVHVKLAEQVDNTGRVRGWVSRVSRYQEFKLITSL